MSKQNNTSSKSEMKGKFSKRRPVDNTCVDDSRRYKQDPFWYAQDERAIQNMGNIPFNTPFGAGFEQPNITNHVDLVPGVVVNWFSPCIYSDVQQSDSYATRAAHAYYQYVTQGFTGGVDFEAPDLLMTAIAGSQVFMGMAAIKRMMGIVHYYLQLNPWYAEKLVSSIGLDYSDLVNNYRDYVARYNVMAAQINKTIAVPAKFFAAQRWVFLASYLFSDAADPEYSTLYMWMPKTILQYDATTMPTGTCLMEADFVPVHSSSNLYTLGDLMNNVDHCIRLLLDDDVRAIFGAVRRVYSDGEFMKIQPYADDFATPILKHDVMAMEFHNMETLNMSPTDRASVLASPSAVTYYDGQGHLEATKVRVYQDENGRIGDSYYILEGESAMYNPLANSSNRAGADHILDLYDHMVNPGNVLDATAFKLAIAKSAGFNVADDQLNKPAHKLNFRSEIILGMEVVVLATTTPYLSFIAHTCCTTSHLSEYQMGQLTRVDSHPLVGIWKTSLIGYDGFFGELNKYTMISEDLISRTNNLSQYTLLMMPENSKNLLK